MTNEYFKIRSKELILKKSKKLVVVLRLVLKLVVTKKKWQKKVLVQGPRLIGALKSGLLKLGAEKKVAKELVTTP